MRDLLAHSVRPDRLPSLLPRSHRPGRVPGRYRYVPARIRTAHPGDLLGPWLHSPGVHPRGCAQALASPRWPGAMDPAARWPASSSAFRRSNGRSVDVPAARDWRERTAPTEHDAWRGRLLVGEVHDENAWALGGVAGHAGYSGRPPRSAPSRAQCCARSRGNHAGATRRPPRVHASARPFPAARARSDGTRCCPTSSCGTLMSATAIGHTGFTGTSLWIDWERDLYIVLLTNRVHPSRENERLRALRPKFHDAAVAEIVNCKL